MFEVSASKVFMWEQDEETGPLKSQKRILFHAFALPSTLSPIIYRISCVWIAVYYNCFPVSGIVFILKLATKITV